MSGLRGPVLRDSGLNKELALQITQTGAGSAHLQKHVSVCKQPAVWPRVLLLWFEGRSPLVSAKEIISARCQLQLHRTQEKKRQKSEDFTADSGSASTDVHLY